MSRFVVALSQIYHSSIKEQLKNNEKMTQCSPTVTSFRVERFALLKVYLEERDATPVKLPVMITCELMRGCFHNLKARDLPHNAITKTPEIITTRSH